MRKTRTTRFASVIAAIAILISVFCTAGATTASAAADKVSLYYANKIYSHHYDSYEVFIKTNDNAQDQKVYAHYNYTGIIGWLDAEAAYVTTLDDGSKIWKATFTTVPNQFSVKYEADGVTYWDDNNGNYYTSSTLGSAPIKADRWNGYSLNEEYFAINATLQNYAYVKNVFVRYTTDGWNTYSDKALGYDLTYSNGTEKWSTEIDIRNANNNGSYDGFEYAICYQVNGQTYWANNFGANYDINYCVAH